MSRPDPRRHEITTLLRGSTVNLVGGILTAASRVVSVFLLTRILTDLPDLGAFLTTVAAVNLGGKVAQLGTGTGLIRFVSRMRVRGRDADLRRLVRVGLLPSLLVSVALSVALARGADAVAAILADENPAQVAHHLRLAVIFLPAVTMTGALTAATRGWGTMVPATVIANIVRPGLQVVALAWVWAVAPGSELAVGLAYWAPMAVAALVAAVVLAHRLVPARADSAGRARLAGRYWRFTAPRAVSSSLASAIEWGDALFIAASAGPRTAGIYAASTRILVVGRTVQFAATQALLPQVSRLLAVGRRPDAQAVFRTAAAWSIALTWPWFVFVLVFAEPLLGLLGPGFLAAAPAVRVLAVAWMVGTALGPVEAVLLMAGRSVWNLVDLGTALAVNVVLNLLLIPRLGMVGAAMAWTASILVNNLLPVVQVRRSTGMTPLGASALRLAGFAVVAFAGTGLLVTSLLGSTPTTAMLSAPLGLGVYVGLLARFDPDGHLPAVLRMLVRHRAAPRSADGTVDPPATVGGAAPLGP